MIVTGKRQNLKIVSENESGYLLECPDRYEVFMPGSLCKEKFAVPSKIDVFVYLDAQGDALATPQIPTVELGDLAVLKVKSSSKNGTFIDMGLPKDLVIPLKLQQFKMLAGEFHLVKILLDEKTNRLFGTSKVSSYLEDGRKKLELRQEISIVPFRRTPLGYKVLIEKNFMGMIFHNEIFKQIELGQTYLGSVKALKENGHVDALIHSSGLSSLQLSRELILAKLKNSGGKLSLSDRSTPAEIKTQLQMSKQAFKKAIGMLYKGGDILIKDGCIELQNHSS